MHHRVVNAVKQPEYAEKVGGENFAIANKRFDMILPRTIHFIFGCGRS